MVAAAESLRVSRRAFGAWGPELVVLLHPWRLDEAFVPGPIEVRASREGALPLPLPAGLAPGDVLSVQVRLPARPSEARGVALRVGARRFTLAPLRRVGAESVFVSPRFLLETAADDAVLEFPLGPPERGQVRLVVRRWLPPAGVLQ
jgi:hypothetical protein